MTAKDYSGGCHCKRVRYEVTADLGKSITCNCSHCAAKGLILSFVPAAQFQLLQGEDALADYQFNKHVIHHLFCKNCGTQSFARGKGQNGADMVAINVRCLDGVDISALSPMPYDGLSK